MMAPWQQPSLTQSDQAEMHEGQRGQARLQNAAYGLNCFKFFL